MPSPVNASALEKLMQRVDAAADGAPMVDAVRRLLDIELVVIDSLQSLASGASTLDEELAIGVRQLKAAAVDSHLALLVTAHLPGLTRGLPARSACVGVGPPLFWSGARRGFTPILLSVRLPAMVQLLSDPIRL